MKLIALIVMFMTIIVSRSVVMIEDVNDIKLSEIEFSDNYKIVSTNSKKLISNFKFIINKKITMFDSGEFNSIYRPAYVLYYPRTRDEFEINIYIINFDLPVFAMGISGVYQITRGYKNEVMTLESDKQGKMVHSADTSSANRVFMRADAEGLSDKVIYSIYSFERMAVIIDIHVQEEYYEKYEEDIKQISENFQFLNPFIPENHVEEFKNDVFSYLYPKGWNPTRFVEATKDTAAVDGIRPWGMSLRLPGDDDGTDFPHFALYTYNLPFYRWEHVHYKLPFVDILKNENVIVDEDFIKGYQYEDNGETIVWKFIYYWLIKENNLKMNTAVSFIRLKETNKIAVLVYDMIDLQLNATERSEKVFRVSCIAESAEFIIFSTLSNDYEPYFADKFYLE